MPSCCVLLLTTSWAALGLTGYQALGDDWFFHLGLCLIPRVFNQGNHHWLCNPMCNTCFVNIKEEASQAFVSSLNLAWKVFPVSLSPKAETVSICDFKLAHVVILLCIFPEGILWKDFCIHVKGNISAVFHKHWLRRTKWLTATCAVVEAHKHTIICFVINNHRLRLFP